MTRISCKSDQARQDIQLCSGAKWALCGAGAVCFNGLESRREKRASESEQDVRDC